MVSLLDLLGACIDSGRAGFVPSVFFELMAEVPQLFNQRSTGEAGLGKRPTCARQSTELTTVLYSICIIWYDIH